MTESVKERESDERIKGCFPSVCDGTGVVVGDATAAAAVVIVSSNIMQWTFRYGYTHAQRAYMVFRFERIERYN